ncbi:MAG: hypothetical protein IJI13_07545 [Oscillospiraceae bacterium]|nr:hypothetical protein [Oscillospiraceae bacterium]
MNNHEEEFDDAAVVRLDPQLVQRVYALVKDLPLETTMTRTTHWKKAPPR